MAKDKIYGFGIAIVFLLLLLVYTVVVPIPILMKFLDPMMTDFMGITPELTNLFLMVPVFMGVLLFSIIIIWIGWTMATTPPPEPIDLDSLDLDDDDDETTESTA